MWEERIGSARETSIHIVSAGSFSSRTLSPRTPLVFSWHPLPTLSLFAYQPYFNRRHLPCGSCTTAPLAMALAHLPTTAALTLSPQEPFPSLHSSLMTRSRTTHHPAVHVLRLALAQLHYVSVYGLDRGGKACLPAVHDVVIRRPHQLRRHDVNVPSDPIIAFAGCGVRGANDISK